MSLSVASLHVYPVKSCGGVTVEQGVITPTGFRYDRNWVVINEKGRFVTQRQKPEMALVSVSLQPQALLEDASAEEGQYPDATLVLQAPGMPTLQVPLNPGRRQGPSTKVTVWEWTGLGADEGAEAAAWWSQYLGHEARLVRYAGEPGQPGEIKAGKEDSTRRQVDPEWTEAGEETAFSDGFPFLVANEASLTDLNAHLPPDEGPLKLNRFRPNVVVAGAPAWAEDGWLRLRLGASATLHLVKPCDRCAVTTTEQETGVVGYEPLRTLRVVRSGKVLGWSEAVPRFKGAVFFAWNAVSEGPGGSIRRGDEVEVVQAREGPAVPQKVDQPAPAQAQAQAQRELGAGLTTLQKVALLLAAILVRYLFQYYAAK
ncbi:MOSC domain-containing protein 2, mitochondrial [Auxenochlorella protothecoides]|uniref:MOSC domain-containing protein 2, mitochondrial n=1 Tax=Auxenochlorella protothecoides TaxID=3075 RepID=A0A087SL67_AUXPR|nr:MOSC domain-containing protein 2, mitochondrial [Auxenochlorella protothecoides]KFM26471.1 MOSC domain-containing protein 2, mitochondrial [Auxenochlorella protothecoides]